jgi:hypothetical protein
MATPHETGIQNLPPLNLPPIVDETPPVVTPLPPEVILVPPEKPAPAPKPVPPAVKVPPPPVDRAIRENAAYTVVAWTARFIVGVWMICNFFPLSFITAIAAFGWLQRRMQVIALRGWWRASPRRLEGTFQAFCDALGPDAPVERPRWFWRERIVQYLNRPQRTGAIARFFGTLVDLATLPVHSLWLNFKVGVKGLFATYLLTGWGCFFMLFSWYFGWLNSFHKGYEDAFFGPLSGLFGSFLLIVTLIYVPMAQAHQAAAGDIASFFQFRVVTRLILTRLTAYAFLTAGFALAALVFALPRFVTLSQDFGPNSEELTPQQAYWALSRYWFYWSIPFFFAMLVLRTLSAVIYRSAMLRAVQSGTILISDLPPRLAQWFDKLEILPQAQLPQNTLVAALKTTLSWKYRAVMFGLLFGIWLLFVMWFYVGYFLVFSEYRGMINHPVVQVPCIDWTPWHLVRGEEE